MEKNSHFVLCDFQRAILNEMGVSSWRLADKQTPKVDVENKPQKDVVTSSVVKSKENALANLEKLKVQTRPVEKTDSVLVTFPQSEEMRQIICDVLLAIGLGTKPLKHISSDQLSQYSGYPLCWTQGKTISFYNKQLITPALAELHDPSARKQLWQQLQLAISITTN